MPVDQRGETRAVGSRQVREGCGESGFTLFELLVVCALISVMLAVAAPTLKNSLLTDPLKTSSRQVIGLIKAVREKAVRDQQAYIITFDLAENRIWFRQESAIEMEEPDEVEAEALYVPQPVRIVDIWTRSGGMMDEGQPLLWVSRQGYIDETMIHLENDDDEVLSMLFSPFLGNVRITDGYVEME
ncbi:prepilin-type N-terminal cleavage/methylation domain-containing protein [Desulfoprunum benzoelyticum]|uniref:Prepilin-type N-terminal cleavage/methylation domain-containing protein n=1 Tax=Desulfoprunum benzoelyticum TaxID=1506996 RepID=A0A840UM36_9BACT|nr:prepilin-type N-terminal cleavage/methylation domain-containing protein [Desulfoprunum benzoelyticum]MBB5347357.1 prepilin-type N-terminal cleavage/methylation domain-containing protein [Desulfoprunum benzoelyticum]MBM9530771.1 prepilin-type N-terminal cleavage/methylation domain-containing protein [Desulfoprunum benzoelyticum]